MILARYKTDEYGVRTDERDPAERVGLDKDIVTQEEFMHRILDEIAKAQKPIQANVQW